MPELHIYGEPNIQPNQQEINIQGDENKKILHTIGVELESLGLSKKAVGNLKASIPNGLGEQFSVVHDASTELNVYAVTLNGKKYVYINRHTQDAKDLFDGRIHVDTFGYELVSVPMSRELLEKSLWLLLPKLECAGDFLSDRCATHIHIGIDRDVSLLRKLLKLGLWADELFYSLSGMGGRFRGYSNNAIYARPLISGPHVHIGRDYFQILNWKKALEAKTLSEFFSAYAININREAIKYHPARYFSMNIYSVLLHKTMEFRHFNQSFDPKLITAISRLCQSFVEIAMKSNEDDLSEFEPGNVFELKRPGHYLDILYRLTNMSRELNCIYPISSEDIGTLEEVIYNYKGIGIEDIPVMTHLKENNVDPDMIVLGQLKKSKVKPIPDGHIDIHNIKNASIIRKDEE